jgi:recombination protein RecA
MAKKETETKLPLRELVRRINKSLNFEAVKLATEADNDYIVRRPCGIFSIDLHTAGGLPAGTMVEIAGPEGAGKNLLADMYIAHGQQLYGKDFKCFIVTTEYKYDKLRARQNGVHIALSPAEIDHIEQAQGIAFSKTERQEMQNQIGEFLLIEGGPAENMLDAAIALLRHGEIHIGVIDSLAMLVPEAEAAKDIDEKAQIGARASLQTKFMNKLHNCINSSKTLLIGLNQVRAPIGYTGRYVPQYKLSEAFSVKHGLAGRIEVTSGKKILSKDEIQIGKEIRWSITKGKAGFHEGPAGILDFYFDSGIDVMADLFETIKPYYKQSGGWYELSIGVPEVQKFHGEKKAIEYLRNNPAIVARIKDYLYKEKDVVFLHKEPIDEKQEEAGSTRGRKNSKGRKRKDNS